MATVNADEGIDTGIDPELHDNDIISIPYDPTKIRIETRPSTVDLLVKRIRQDEIDLTPTFQRSENLWNAGVQSRLIESMLIRIPIPAFYIDATNDEYWSIVDGLQRLSVLKRFVIQQDLQLTELEYLSTFHGKRFDELPRSMQRRIEETQVTLYLIQPGTPEDVKLNIFKRINTGGLPLSPQEIRHALYQGKATRLLEKLAEDALFRKLVGKHSHNSRMADREFVLRFVAFSITPPSQYHARDLDSFLNEHMRKLNLMPDDEIEHLERRFLRSLKAADKLFGRYAFRKQYKPKDNRKPVNKALFEAWMINLDELSDPEIRTLVDRKDRLNESFIELMHDSEFHNSVSLATRDVSKLERRFSGIKEIIRGVLQGC